MSDKDLVACEQDHEMNTILARYGKRQTTVNRERLRVHCRKWKATPSYSPHNRGSFYRYIDNNNVMLEMD
jgi:hypothetical protein